MTALRLEQFAERFGQNAQPDNRFAAFRRHRQPHRDPRVRRHRHRTIVEVQYSPVGQANDVAGVPCAQRHVELVGELTLDFPCSQRISRARFIVSGRHRANPIPDCGPVRVACPQSGIRGLAQEPARADSMRHRISPFGVTGEIRRYLAGA